MDTTTALKKIQDKDARDYFSFLCEIKAITPATFHDFTLWAKSVDRDEYINEALEVEFDKLPWFQTTAPSGSTIILDPEISGVYVLVPEGARDIKAEPGQDVYIYRMGQYLNSNNPFVPEVPEVEQVEPTQGDITDIIPPIAPTKEMPSIISRDESYPDAVYEDVSMFGPVLELAGKEPDDRYIYRDIPVISPVDSKPGFAWRSIAFAMSLLVGVTSASFVYSFLTVGAVSFDVWAVQSSEYTNQEVLITMMLAVVFLCASTYLGAKAGKWAYRKFIQWTHLLY